jgi:hypothetical protein
VREAADSVKACRTSCSALSGCVLVLEALAEPSVHGSYERPDATDIK